MAAQVIDIPPIAAEAIDDGLTGGETIRDAPISNNQQIPTDGSEVAKLCKNYCETALKVLWNEFIWTFIFISLIYLMDTSRKLQYFGTV